MRHYLGGERYHVAPLGLADDFQDAADDADVLTFADAQRAALAHKQARQRRGKGKTVAEAIKDYVADVRTERPATADDAEQTAAQLILPTLGRIKLADLTTDDITDWRNALAKQGARLRTRPGEKQKFKAAPATKEELRARRATVNRILGVLKAALNAAVAPARREGITLDPTPWQSVEPFKKVDAARPGFLSVSRNASGSSMPPTRRAVFAISFAGRSPPAAAMASCAPLRSAISRAARSTFGKVRAAGRAMLC